MQKVILFCSFIVVSFFFGQLFAQDCRLSPQEIVNVKDKKFGAVGDSLHDDSRAFILCAQYINANWSPEKRLVFFIPKGAYRVGLQVAIGGKLEIGNQQFDNTKVESYLPVNIIELKCAGNVTIKGEAGTKIIYNDKLKFGGYAPGLFNAPPVPFNCPAGYGSPDGAAEIGMFISLTDCSCITIENLNIDGNRKNTIIGGKYSDGYQTKHDGIEIKRCKDIDLKDLIINDFCRDGIDIWTGSIAGNCGNKASNSMHINISNVWCTNNFRNGMSLGAISFLTVKDSHFDSSGGGAKYMNSPEAGVDLEPDGDGGSVNNLLFDHCWFLNNHSFGLISDNGATTIVSDVTCENCIFSEGAEYALRNSKHLSFVLWPGHIRNAKFIGCEIYGHLIHVAGTSSTDIMLFKNCHITDSPDKNYEVPFTGQNYIIDAGDWNGGYAYNLPPEISNYFNFDHCRFDLHYNLLSTMGCLVNDHKVACNAQVKYHDRYFNNNEFHFYIHDLDSVLGLKESKFSHATDIGYFGACTLNSNRFYEVTKNKSLQPNSKYRILVSVPNNANSPNPYSCEKYQCNNQKYYCNGYVESDGRNSFFTDTSPPCMTTIGWYNDPSNGVSMWTCDF